MSNIKNNVNITISSTNNNYKRDISCLVIPRITDNISNISFSKTILKIPTNIQLADPNFNKSDTVDVLIGSLIFWELLCGGQVRLQNANIIL